MEEGIKFLEFEGVMPATFLGRPNRFTIKVMVNGVVRYCHLRESGRLKELLVEGAEVLVREVTRRSLAKTYCDAVMVKAGSGIYVVIDSRVPNALFKELFRSGMFKIPSGELHEEFKVGGSRIDFLVVSGSTYNLVEVKGCTLVKDGRCLFPDAPSARASRQLDSLVKAAGSGWGAWVVFMVLREDGFSVAPNRGLDPLFANKLSLATKKGVKLTGYRFKAVRSGDRAAIYFLGEVPVTLT